jgi:hypothetical protein
METIRALMAEIDALQDKIGAVLEGMVEVDCEACPGVPKDMLRTLRVVRHQFAWCPCSWLRRQAETILKNGLPEAHR